MLLRSVAAVCMGLVIVVAPQYGHSTLAVAQGDASPREFVNSLPVDVLLLTYAPGEKKFTSIRVPPQERRSLPNAAILAMEPLSAAVGRREVFTSCVTERLGTDNAELQAVVRELKDIELLETASARERLEAASALAQLQLEQRQDEKNTFRNDPLRNELQRQQERYVTQKSIQEILAERNESMSNLASDVADLALAWSSVQQEKLQILYTQVHTLKPLVEQAKLAYKIKEDEYSALERTVSAWQAYSSSVAEALDRTAGPNSEIIAAASVRKRCDGPSREFDVIDLEGPNSLVSSTLIAEVSFNRGGKQRTFFRRIGKSERWSGRIEWPSAATAATIRIRWPGATRWYSTQGAIETARPSIAVSLTDANRAVNEVQKKLKDDNFRAAGGDHIRTVPSF